MVGNEILISLFTELLIKTLKPIAQDKDDRLFPFFFYFLFFKIFLKEGELTLE